MTALPNACRAYLSSGHALRPTSSVATKTRNRHLVCITAILRGSCRTKTILFGGNVAAAEGIVEAAYAATDVLMTAARTWKGCEQAIGGAEATDRTRFTQVTWAR